MTSPTRKPVVRLNSFDDLSKVILLQRVITRQAKEKLNAVVDRVKSPDADENAEHKYFSEIMKEQSELLKSYVSLPTLTEFAEQPSLHGQFIWGTTFGVTLLMSEIILQHIHSPSLKLSSINRFLLVRLLQEIRDTYADEEGMFFRVVTTANIKLPTISDPEEHDRAVMEIVAPILEGILLLLVEYGLIDSKGGHYFLTDSGSRTLLHLVDAQRFIEEVTAAHRGFQKDKEVNKVADEDLALVD